MKEARKKKPQLEFAQGEMFGDHGTYVVIAHNYSIVGKESVWISSQIMWRTKK